MFGWNEKKNERNTPERHTDPADEELERLKREYGDGSSLDPEKALEYLLHVGLHGGFQTAEVVEGKHILLPAWNIRITPVIDELAQGQVVLDFYVYSPAWGKQLYECCAAPGSSTGQAMGMAIGSFLFCFMQGIARMEKKAQPRALETVFAGKSHRWQVYLSDLVGTGEKVEQAGPTLYWDALKDEVVKRLGNQKLCYVKVYGAKIGGEVIGECRIDDVKSEQLSDLVAGLVRKWDVQGYASHKQFFFLRQEEETVLPNPYWGSDGHEALMEKVRQAVDLFRQADTEEKYDDLPNRYARLFGDRTLAQELHCFLPEICAEIAFGEKVRLAEQIGLSLGSEKPVWVYKNQLADYYALRDAIDHLLRSGVYGGQADDIFRQYVSMSATYSGLCQAERNGSALEGARQALLIPVSEDFELR